MASCNLIHSKSSQSEAAAVVFAAAFLDFAPKIQFVEMQCDPLAFECEFVTSEILNEEAFPFIEERARHLLRHEQAQSFEMMATVAKDFLKHHSQKVQAEALEEGKHLVSLVRFGAFVGYFNGTVDDIKNVRDMKILKVTLKEKIPAGNKFLYRLRFHVTSATSEENIKDRLKQIKASEKNSYLVQGVKNGFIGPIDEITQEAIIFPKGVTLLAELKKLITDYCHKSGFHEIITPSLDIEEMIIAHADYQQMAKSSKSFEWKSLVSDDEAVQSFLFQSSLATYAIGLMFCKEGHMSAALHETLKTIEGLLQLFEVEISMMLSEKTPKNRSMHDLLYSHLKDKLMDGIVEDTLASNAARAAFIYEDSVGRLWPLMWLELKKSENGIGELCISFGSLESLLAVIIEISDGKLPSFEKNVTL